MLQSSTQVRTKSSQGVIPYVLRSGGIVAPFQTLTFRSDYIQESSASLAMYIANVSCQLLVIGTVSLSGTLNRTSVTGYSPLSPTHRAFISGYRSLSGQFSNIPSNEITYGTNNVTVQIDGIL